MDLHNKSAQFSQVGKIAKNGKFGDTTLCLNHLEFGRSNNHLEFGRSNSGRYGYAPENIPADFANSPDDGCRLVLGLGPTTGMFCDDLYNGRKKMHKQVSAAIHHGLTSESDSILCLGLSGGTNDTSSVLDGSLSTEIDVNAPPYHADQVSSKNNLHWIPVVDEGSTSAKKSGGYMPSLLLAPMMDSEKLSQPARELFEFGAQAQHVEESLLTTNYSNGAFTEQTSTRSDPENRVVASKKCKFLGCTKGARGASGLCIGHGGGQRCQKPGCNKGAESRTAYCKAHGGGKRCQHLGCTKSAEGKTEHCIAHGGGRRCGYAGGCSKAARGKSGLCIKHGGGKRCKVEGCTRSAEGHAGLCISHGGGRRCQYDGCSKGAQGSTMFCKAHGGGKRCIFTGCNKGAEGSTPLCKGHGGGKRCLYDGGGICPKSVHGGTKFCVAHGGGKRCAVSGCTKSARGRTDCCVKHGGGKRCKFYNCEKSAQGSTDFCKAHGGGKRCTWGEGKCDKFARGKSGLCAAHSSMALVREPNKEGLIGPGLFHGLISVASTGSLDNYQSSSAVSVISDSNDSAEKPIKRRQLIPSQVLVPLSMKSSTSYSSLLSLEKPEEARNENGIDFPDAQKRFEFVVPEGRVHGGGLMSFLGGNLRSADDRL